MTIVSTAKKNNFQVTEIEEEDAGAEILTSPMLNL
jgi:hypothetical protein